MKYFKIIPIIIAAIISNIACESDDICPESTPTTPRLIIDLFDISNQESSKNAFKLVAIGIGNEVPLPDYTIVTTNKLILPLKTDASTTQYLLHKDYTYSDNGTPDDTSDDIIGGNPDVISINYSTEEVYVSRACGYKTVFKNVTLTIESDSDNWIQLKQSINDNQSVEDETTAHFNIFH